MAKIKYRPEIDGLRALAVLSVIGFHAGIYGFSGGYLGVDIFFAISGYLITAVILAEKHAGTFSLSDFYTRRARRILPALFMVLLVCLPFSWLWMVPEQLVEFSKTLLAVPLFASNVLFWRTAGYFGPAIETTPLLHTWSLGVEEQYYLLFPVFLLVLWERGRRRLLCATIAIVLASLVFSQWGSIYHPDFTFFLAPTRAWELLLGSILALIAFEKPVNDYVSRYVAQILSLLGFVLIIISIAFYDEYIPTPSLYTFVPVFGAVLILGFAMKDTLVGKLLSQKFFVNIGLVSYSAYLWHQPVFAFARIYLLAPISPEFTIVLLVLISVLSFLTWRYVEMPFRNISFVSFFQFASFSFAFSLFFLSAGIIGFMCHGFENRFDLPAGLVNSLKMHQDSCFDLDGNFSPCVLIKSNNKEHIFFLLGDSHVPALEPAFELASRRLGINGYAAAHSCAPLLGEHQAMKCSEFQIQALKFSKINKIKNVFLVSRWSKYAKIGTKMRRYFREDFENTVNEYGKIGAHIYIVEQVPEQKNCALEIYFRKINERDFIKRFSVSRKSHQEYQFFISSVFEKFRADPRVTFVSLEELFCDQTMCPFGTETVSFYADANHLSITGALRVTDYIEAVMRTIPTETQT